MCVCVCVCVEVEGGVKGMGVTHYFPVFHLKALFVYKVSRLLDEIIKYILTKYILTMCMHLPDVCIISCFQAVGFQRRQLLHVSLRSCYGRTRSQW